MSNDVKITKFSETGKFLFVHSDKFDIYVVYQTADEKLYFIECDKLFNIKSASEITASKTFYDNTNLKWFKPQVKDDVLVLSGAVTINNVTHRFSLSNDHLDILEVIEYNDGRQIGLLSCLKDFTIASLIQKRDKVHLVGYDNKVPHPNSFYGVVDILTDKFECLYYLYSDIGDITLSSINLDLEEFKTYCVGHIDVVDENEEVVDTRPYIECFTFKG